MTPKQPYSRIGISASLGATMYISPSVEMKRRKACTKDGEHSLDATHQGSHHKTNTRKVVLRLRLRTVLTLWVSATALLGLRELFSIIPQGSPNTRRFPKYGTKEFAQQCEWNMLAEQKQPVCTFLMRIYPGGHEGIADWLSKVASGFISAKQIGCNLLMDYGDSVDLSQVLIPLSTNWTIPLGFQCSRHNRCINESTWTAIHMAPEASLHRIGEYLGRKVARAPDYRHAYVSTPYLYPTIFQDLQQGLPGFVVENGMACSLGSLFDLAPSTSQFQPDLFTKILPNLRDESALVIAIYYRTGQTDRMATAEKNGAVGKERTKQYENQARPCFECAVYVEQKYVMKSKEVGISFSRIVWMFVTDSAYLKQWVSETYNSRKAGEQVSVNKHVRNSNDISREILTTTSRGIHTRSARNPSTADFAEAMIDWYLIGESDLVVTNNRWYSFGATASLRTNRPLYDARNCSRLPRFGPPRYKSALEVGGHKE